jgi:aryl-alcohol dehydrogenase-like predicted oxidoreductase
MSDLPQHSQFKPLLLGTALWGWGVDQAMAFQMLDAFAAAGGVWVDTAVNYPINQNLADNGKALAWITQWLSSHRATPLRVLVKIGALDNSGSNQVNLSAAHIAASAEMLRQTLGPRLGAVAVHWDPRSLDTDYPEIQRTVSAMQQLHANGLTVGFSGVTRPDFYQRAAPELADAWWIQVKENALTAQARLKYQTYFPNAYYLAYGINMGGLKNEPAADTSSAALRGVRITADIPERLQAFLNSPHGITPAPQNFNDIALLSSYLNPALHAVIIGPRNGAQLHSSTTYWHALHAHCPANTVAKLDLPMP